MAAALSEPQVLAHTKRHLFAETTERSYSVCDTQFAQSEWLSGQSISPQIRDDLAPFNHVEVGDGYPDLVGVHPLDESYIAADHNPSEPPLVAIEAKGHTESGSVDIEKGLQQAYSYLEEANTVYLTAPADAISQGIQSAARELNVGLLSVGSDGGLTPITTPRVVGNRTSDEASAVRFQATAQGVADKSFSLNHPKNYLGYPLALYHSAPTEEVLSEYVVGDVSGARKGASFLGLIEETPTGEELTPLGTEVVRFALSRYDSVDAAIAQFEAWHRSQQRFADLVPQWGLLARRVLWAYPATQLIVEELQTLHDAGVVEPSIIDLVEHLHATHPTFTVELFIRGTDDARSKVLTEDGALRVDQLDDGNRYHAPTVFQLKTMLFHAGILTESGDEPSKLTPEVDLWKLREPLD
jgi:hypothetical protein